MADKTETVSRVAAYIEAHLTEKLDLDLIARGVHYSKYHLHRVFTETVGMTIHDYKKRRQLTEAAKILVFGAEPIVDIAHMAGYENQQAFTTVFKDLYKATPHQFREREEFYPLQLEYNFSNGPKPEGEKAGDPPVIRFAGEDDIELWMELVRLAVDGFPNLHEEEHVTSLKRYIENRGALFMTGSGRAIGSMLLCYDTGSIDFLAVHPLYRNQGINRQLLERAIIELLDKKQIRITTFREGDKADTGYRKALKELGFAEGQLLTEFGYPTQEMILPRGETKNE